MTTQNAKETYSVSRHEPINVLDFGAQGDGNADDTAAINAAFGAMRQLSFVTHPDLRRQWGGPEWFPASCPAVVFPCGHYKISGPIDISGRFTSLSDRDLGAHMIHGDGAVIDQTDPAKNLFVSTYSNMIHLEGFKFVGGRHQVWLDAPNTSGAFRVTDCEFHESLGFAVIFGYHCPSTHAYMSRCCFLNCEQWVYSMTDMAKFHDIHGGMRAGMSNKAAFDLRSGMVTFDSVMCSPWADSVDQRWIDNRAWHLKLVNSRFGGEFGGVTLVRNFARYVKNSIYQNSITIDNCYLCNQSNLKRPGVIYCDEIPNRILVRNSPVSGIPVITVDPKINLEHYFTGVDRGLLDYAVEHCTGQLSDMPDGLRDPVIVPEPDQMLPDAEVAALMAKAREDLQAAAANPWPWTDAGPAVSRGHAEQTDPAKFVEIPAEYWTLEGCADTEKNPNAHYLAMTQVDQGIMLMNRHRKPGSGWALVKGVEIDVDQTPYLTFRLHPLRFGYLPVTLRIVDRETSSSMLVETAWGGRLTGQTTEAANVSAYHAIDLRTSFTGGRHIFDLRVYLTGSVCCEPDDPEMARAVERGQTVCNREGSEWDPNGLPQICVWGEYLLVPLEPGHYTVLEYLRAEAE